MIYTSGLQRTVGDTSSSELVEDGLVARRAQALS